ncbi:MAG: hydantoinase B/oxoprolinase family protein, partial [Alphaproteobacteria bacterium]|nr:hydantoinase B/oxoprolinase family protein [Alphaproteobacteria bacterium]
TVIVQPGSSVRIVTTGGGGWGDPLKREVERVVYDVQCGVVSKKQAKALYGVVLNKVGRKFAADMKATKALRQQMAKARGKPPMFDRGPYFEKLKKKGAVKHPPGWSDPDHGWHAQLVPSM